MGRRVKKDTSATPAPLEEVNNHSFKSDKPKSSKTKKKIPENGESTVNETAEKSKDRKQRNGTKSKDIDVSCITDKLKDLFNFQPRKNAEPSFHVFGKVMLNSKNFVHQLHCRSLGMKQNAAQNRRSHQPLVEHLSSLRVFRVAAPFDRRVMVLDWHPHDPNILIAGSKNGDLIYMNVNNVENIHTIEGGGIGSQLNAMKLWPTDSEQVITASVDGTVTLQDFTSDAKTVFLDTHMPVSEWYCSLDVSYSNRVFAAGDNRGVVRLLTLDGKQVWAQKLHKSKVHHIEFNKRQPWMMATAGLDKTVKVWDIRAIDEKSKFDKKNPGYLVSLEQLAGTTAAYFSLTDGTRLLTTDQMNQLKVYRGPEWRLETTIIHPHRCFQHLTPIKAQWHPLVDVISVGRYPHDACPGSSGKEARTVDVFCAETGAMLTQIYDPSISGIISLNVYNRGGDMLASAMGRNIVIWRRSDELLEKQDQLLENILENDPDIMKGQKRKDATDTVRKNTKKMKTSRDDADDLKKKVKVKTKVKEDKSDKGKKK